MSAAPAQSGTILTKGSYPAVGTLINGKYLVEKLIGEGGVGIVVSAQNVELGDRVALKFLRAEMLDRPDVVGRFVFEAKAACSIKSDHSATVFDVGRTPDGVPFLVMEFLEGRDLASIIETHGALEVRDVAEYALQTCEALAVAHAKGIIHRDIKPENLFVEIKSGMKSIKVLDFGISKLALTGSVTSTLVPLVETQHLMGTPLYMSPEQVRSPEKVDTRTDIWSLGVVLYEALTGALPIVSESITELCAAILEQPVTPIEKYRNDLPPELVTVIEKCLEKDVAKRYQNVAEVALALLPFAPKRARICAERAGEVLVAAGIVDAESVRFQSTIPSSTGSFPIQHVPPPPSVPRNLHVPASSGSLRDAAVTLSGDIDEPKRPEPEKKQSNAKLLAVAALVLGLVGIGAAMFARGGGEAKTAAPLQPSATPAPVVKEPAPPASATVATARTPPVEAPTATPEPLPAKAAPVPRALPRGGAAVNAAGKATKPAPATSTAAKQSESLDIGY